MLHTKLYNDQDLLEELKAGNETAFTELYQQYHAAIYFYLLDFVKAPQIAEDLVHEVFMKIWEIRQHLVITTSFSAYLYRISHNKAIDMLKKISRDEQLRNEVFKWLEPQLSEFDTNSKTVKYEQLYMDAVSALAPQRQKVFILCREKGKTYHEAAQELGISRNTVKEHMVQALRFMRNFLSEKGELTILVIVLNNIL